MPPQASQTCFSTKKSYKLKELKWMPLPASFTTRPPKAVQARVVGLPDSVSSMGIVTDTENILTES